jgi:hypothetical protein
MAKELPFMNAVNLNGDNHTQDINEEKTTQKGQRRNEGRNDASIGSRTYPRSDNEPAGILASFFQRLAKATT